MAYCGPLGIPLSEFLSWDEGDQDAALSWQSREATKCGGCGTYADDWAAGIHALDIEVVACPGCAKLAAAQQDRGGSANHFRWRRMIDEDEEVG